jgi:LuxR family maltose regulon positive regulatory protein
LQWLASESLRRSDSALELLHEAERLYVGDLFPNVAYRRAEGTAGGQPGQVGRSTGWARAQGLSVDDTLAYLREFEHITLAQSSWRSINSPLPSTCLRLWDYWRLLQAAQSGGRTGSHRNSILQALAYQTQGDTFAALASLKTSDAG